MADELMLEDVQPPPNARQYINIDDLHRTFVALHEWALQHMQLFSEYIPEDAAAVSLRAVPSRAFFHSQALVILSAQLTGARRLREWYDYLVRENENNWTAKPVLQNRLALLQTAISFLNQLGETLEQRELREEQQRGGGLAIVMAPGLFAPQAGSPPHGHVPPPPSFGQTP